MTIQKRKSGPKLRRIPGTIGARITEVREARGLTVKQLAELTGLGSQTIHLLENLQEARRSVLVLMKLAEALDVPLEELVYGKK